MNGEGLTINLAFLLLSTFGQETMTDHMVKDAVSNYQQGGSVHELAAYFRQCTSGSLAKMLE